jgi:hypothetical protein
MKRFLQMCALMALLLMGSVTMEAGKVLTYDFMTNHPSTTIRIDQGYKEIRGNFAYWTGAWAGLFGNKIAFDATNAYPSLLAQGGLCDFHDRQKTYVMNLSPGDKVTFNYTGENAALQYHVSSTASMSGLTANYAPIASGTPYTVTGAGNLCVLNRWEQDEAETIITSIVIESVKEYEEVSISYGMRTFCCTVPLDFSQTQNLKAFIATGFDNGKFIFKQVKYVPSATGFLIVSQGGTATSANIPVGRSSNYRDNAITGNLFEGSLGSFVRIVVPTGKAAYMFGVSKGEVGIYRTANAFSCAPNKAYLLINTSE